jgi:predicted dinucleotide-binding enzyme
MKVAVIGTGGVGQTIASKLISLGHQVMIGTRNVAEKLASPAAKGSGNPHFADWLRQNQHIQLGTFAETAAFGELIVNASQGRNSVIALIKAETKNLNGKILIDIANPLDFSKGMPPSLIAELSNTHSLGEEIQKSFPQAKVVKTLNTMWAGLMVNPSMVNNGNHVNFICGNDPEAKQTVKSLLNEFGWRNENIIDLGDITAARGSEAILLTWLRIMGVMQGGAFNFNIVS